MVQKGASGFLASWRDAHRWWNDFGSFCLSGRNPYIQTAEFGDSIFGGAGGIRNAHPGNRAHEWNPRFGW